MTMEDISEKWHIRKHSRENKKFTVNFICYLHLYEFQNIIV